MGGNILRNLSKNYFHGLSEKGLLLNNLGDFNDTIIAAKQLKQWRTYAESSHQLRKTNSSFSRFSTPFVCRSFSSPTYSSSSTSSSRFSFVGWYLKKLETQPLITKSISTSIVYVAADVTSQMITMPTFGTLDLLRTLRMAAYGLLILGPSQHLWFNFLSKVLPSTDVLSTLKKILMGQAIYGPCINAAFFSYNAGLKGESNDEIVARLKRDLLPTMITGLIYWPLCDFVTFKFVPVHLQPLVNSSCAYVWTIYLTYMACLEKVSN